MTKPVPSHLAANGHLLAAVDLETTGVVAGYHEIIQIAVVALDSNLEVSKDYRQFYMNLIPEHPERIDKKSMSVNGLTLEELQATGVTPYKAADLFIEWFEALNLPLGKRLIPVVHNWLFEGTFLPAWLGNEAFNEIWHACPRDTLSVLAFINDALVFKGLYPPFSKLSLTHACKKLGIFNAHAHNALGDALAGAELYKQLITLVNQ